MHLGIVLLLASDSPSNRARRRDAVASSSVCASCEHQVWSQDVKKNCDVHMGVSIKMGVPQKGWFIRENPI